MIKIKWLNNCCEKPAVSIKVEGSLEIKSPSYDSYEEYVKKEKKEALKKEVAKYVDELLRNPHENRVHGPYCLPNLESYQEARGFNRAKEKLVEIILKEIEID